MTKSNKKAMNNVIVWFITLPYQLWINKKISFGLKLIGLSTWVIALVVFVVFALSGFVLEPDSNIAGAQEKLTPQDEITFVDQPNSPTTQNSISKDSIAEKVSGMIKTNSKERFEVTNVVDGDTIKISQLGTLRLIGIDTPETKDPRKPVQCFGKEASDRAKQLLSGQKVYLEFDAGNRFDKYDRLLAYVYRDDGYFYNLEMVKDGYAHSYVQYPHPKLDEFNEAQTNARETKLGFWSPESCNGDTNQVVKK